MNGFADRREHVRFDITGQLWASLDVSAETTLHDLSLSGALVETPSGFLWLALRTLTVRLGPDGAAITGVVRHVSQSRADPQKQIVGLEFIHLTPEAITELEERIGEWGA